MSALLKCLAKKCVLMALGRPLVHVGEQRFPALLPFWVCDTRNGYVLRETSGLGGHAVFGSRFRGWVFSSQQKALVTMIWIACVEVHTPLKKGRACSFLTGCFPVIVSLHSKENVDKGAMLHKVHHSDANRHM